MSAGLSSERQWWHVKLCVSSCISDTRFATIVFHLEEGAFNHETILESDHIIQHWSWKLSTNCAKSNAAQNSRRGSVGLFDGFHFWFGTQQSNIDISVIFYLSNINTSSICYFWQISKSMNFFYFFRFIRHQYSAWDFQFLHDRQFFDKWVSELHFLYR